MIKNLTIENFQSHKHTSLDFHPGVNVILGLSDVGKSSILRALNWVAFNNPSGDFFRSDFTKKDTKVSVTFDSEDTVVRRRGKDNCYLVNDQKFKALGTKVPEEVSDLFNMDDVNMQPQWQSYFMLDQSSGQVARSLNAISGLEDMDLSMKAINSKIKDSNTEVSNLAEDIKECEEEIEALSWIDAAKTELQDISSIHDKIAEKRQEQGSLASLLTRYETLQIELKTLPDFSALPTIKELLQLDEHIESLVDGADKLQVLVGKEATLQEQLSELDFVPKAKQDLEVCQQMHQQILADIESRSCLVKKLSELNDIQKSLDDVQKHTDDCRKAVKKCHSEIDVCPTCNREWDSTCDVGGAV